MFACDGCGWDVQWGTGRDFYHSSANFHVIALSKYHCTFVHDAPTDGQGLGAAQVA